MSTAIDESGQAPEVQATLAELCEVFARRGYRGPISFDACLDVDGGYRLIYDCNPRLTAVAAPLILRELLASQGIAVRTQLNLDYRGRYSVDDARRWLRRLDEAGVLARRERPRGVLPLPNIARRRGWDVHLLDMTPEEIRALLRSGLLGSPDHAGKSALDRPYF